MTTPVIGFVIVTYSLPQQTLRLCEKLNREFDDPPIVIHHDFSKSPLDKKCFPGNVHFVEDWGQTAWASMAVVDGQLSCIRLLFERSNPDWFIPLSTSDYPIKAGEFIRAELGRDEYDVYMDYREAKDLGQRYINAGLGPLAFTHPHFAQIAFNRYVAFPLIRPKLARRLKKPPEAYTWGAKFLVKRTTPFDATLRCYAGDHWIIGNRRAARVLLDQTSLWRELHDHFAARVAPEEGFAHTLLGNEAGLRICHDNLRYTDWTDCFAHPRFLNRNDFPELLESPNHFARKFPDDPKLMKDFDNLLSETAAQRPPHQCDVASDRNDVALSR